MYRIGTIRMVTLLALLGSAGLLFAGEPLTAVTEEWPPYNFSEGDEIKGLSTDIIRATLREAGLAAKFEIFPWPRSYKKAKMEANTLIYTILRMPEREEDFQWIKMEGLSESVFLFSPRARPEIVIKSLDDAKRYKIGVSQESASHQFLLSKGFEEGTHLFPVNVASHTVLLSDAKHPRIDLATGDRLSMSIRLKAMEYPPDYWEEELLLFKKDIYMAFGKKTPAHVVKKVRDAYDAIHRAGVVDRLKKGYFEVYKCRNLHCTDVPSEETGPDFEENPPPY